MSLPIAQWQETLDRIEEALASATKALERAEERWEMAVAPSAGEGESPVALDRLDTRLEEWESRLHSADEVIASVEQEVLDRNAAVELWRALFAKWGELLKQREAASPVS